jgi:hypothetical protein
MCTSVGKVAVGHSCEANVQRLILQFLKSVCWSCLRFPQWSGLVVTR